MCRFSGYRGFVQCTGISLANRHTHTCTPTHTCTHTHTGYFDEDGCFYITDRLKELIKVKGFQVAPAELESLLVSHPKLADAAVIGIPNERLGEAPKAFVVKKDNDVTEKDVVEFVAGKVSLRDIYIVVLAYSDEMFQRGGGKSLL